MTTRGHITCVSGLYLTVFLGAVCTLVPSAVGASLKPIVLDPTYQHDRFGTMPQDTVRKFRAYTTSFDGADDNDGNDTPDKWAIPEWVAYELRKKPAGLATAPGRPSKWMTDNELHADEIAPNDASYRGSGYSRGHMCMKSHAWRLGAAADWNTHTVLNACPQKQCMNAGVWLGLENKTADWADEFGTVWIVAGPVFYGETPSKWIGDEGEVRAAVPDAFFKIIAKNSGESGKPDVLAFLIPMEGVTGYCSPNHDPQPYPTSVDVIEALTGLDFFTKDVTDDIEADIEAVVHVRLWE